MASDELSRSDLLDLAGQELRQRVSTIGEESWSLATPCEGWSVRDLFTHVVAGNQRTAYLLGGASHEEANRLVDRDLLEEDPVGACDRTLAAQARAFAPDDALERLCDTSIGMMTGAQLLRFRMLDLVVHAWDLARATGTDEQLDSVLVEHVWRDIAPLVPAMGAMGVFGNGASGTLPEDAPLQRRLLDASGRRP
jgi:uncharacterized protein (TIGR03086 family)